MTHVTQVVACLTVLPSTNRVIALHYIVQQFSVHAAHVAAESYHKATCEAEFWVSWAYCNA